MTPDPILSLRGWSLERRVGSGTRTILSRLDLDVVAGRWTAVLGANGSGKSSLLKYLASEESPLSVPVAIMFQDPDEQIFAASVARELTLGRRDLDPGPLLEEYGLAGTASRDPRLLSAGQKQRLALAVAASQDPDVLLCDEPTALQDPAQARWVLDQMDRWRTRTGGALVTATCDRAEAERADWLVVLQAGSIVRQGPTHEILGTSESVALLGDGRGYGVPSPTDDEPGAGTPVLKVSGLEFEISGSATRLTTPDLLLAPGQRLGVSGPNGCGKSTFLAACAGARRPSHGQVKLCGKRLYGKKGLDLDHGQALLAPQFPEYLFTRSTVEEELALDPVLRSWKPAEFLDRWGLPGDLAQSNPHDLSCGQRRRLALGLVILSGRPLILLDEPTAALDRTGRALVLAMLGELPAGTTLVIASHDREFLTAAGCPILDLSDESP